LFLFLFLFLFLLFLYSISLYSISIIFVLFFIFFYFIFILLLLILIKSLVLLFVDFKELDILQFATFLLFAKVSLNLLNLLIVSKLYAFFNLLNSL